jgi:hypothetical protein
LQVVKAIGEQQLTLRQIMENVGLKDREHFLNNALTPTIVNGFVSMLYPDSPHHPRQKYLLTEQGLSLYYNLTNKH